MYHQSVDFTRIGDFTWRLSDCEELLRLTHWGKRWWFYVHNNTITYYEGDLILFPSTTGHLVDPNETLDQTRISLAFNSI